MNTRDVPFELAARVTDNDPRCDPSNPSLPTLCFTYSVTAPRDGLLEVALTRVPQATTSNYSDLLGLSVIEAGGRAHWRPPDPGITQWVRLQAQKGDFFRISISSIAGEEFELQTLIQ